jgi:FK506-binding protein 1
MPLEIQIITLGNSSRFPKSGEKVKIHYEGFLENGSRIDSSRSRGVPFTFKVGRGEVIRAWDMSLPQIALYSTVLITASPDLAYGSKGLPGAVPPNSFLRFEIELLDIFS